MKKTKIVYLPYPLSDDERRNFERDHPGYKLSFLLRHPRFPLILSIISLIIATLAPIIRAILA